MSSYLKDPSIHQNQNQNHLKQLPQPSFLKSQKHVFQKHQTTTTETTNTVERYITFQISAPSGTQLWEERQKRKMLENQFFADVTGFPKYSDVGIKNWNIDGDCLWGINYIVDTKVRRVEARTDEVEKRLEEIEREWRRQRSILLAES
ncbi:4530_t:CDS:1 [Paraglomus brasilianum]|uniref:4530_t:CDS:1 n=1 Tax=Paraglomus brasilianum TaxID=144538 RepID=A0A9N8VJT3_9GLOM|nr:4530_t:CDS:1 [Paraglomus brasilianum]